MKVNFDVSNKLCRDSYWEKSIVHGEIGHSVEPSSLVKKASTHFKINLAGCFS